MLEYHNDAESHTPDSLQFSFYKSTIPFCHPREGICLFEVVKVSLNVDEKTKTCKFVRLKKNKSASMQKSRLGSIQTVWAVAWINPERRPTSLYVRPKTTNPQLKQTCLDLYQVFCLLRSNCWKRPFWKVQKWSEIEGKFGGNIFFNDGVFVVFCGCVTCEPLWQSDVDHL